MGSARIAAAAFLAMFAANGARAAQCELKLIASYDMVPSDSIVVIPMTMAGKSRYVTLDTGAFGNWVTQKFVDDDKLETHNITAMKVYGTQDRTEKYTVVPSVEIGAIHQPDSNFMVMSGDFGELSAGLGTNALAQFDIEFDFAAQKVKFFSQDHCEGQVVYWTKEYTVLPFSLPDRSMHIDMTLDSHTLDTGFDTGTTYSYINERVLVGTFGRDPSSGKEITLEGQKMRSAAFHSLSIGGVSFPNPSLLVMRDKMRELAKEDVPVKDQNQAGVNLMHFPHLLLGLDAIRHLHIYIAYKERKIYVTSADAH
jgi:hypothetical protein